MNREIKFRAWLENGFRGQRGMFNGFMLWDIESGIEESNVYCENGKIIEEPDWGNMVIMQYTGLKDKNGKERCEGDIIRRNTGYTFVEKKKVFSAGNGTNVIGYDYRNDDEIIGNIYENPELLNNKQ